MQIYTFSPFGYEGSLVTVEVDLRRGIPAVDIIGLADSAVKESRERVRAAFSNSGIEFPAQRVLIALSPCDIKKAAAMDVAIAAGILTQQVKNATDEPVLVLGGLELSGNVRPVCGVHAALNSAIASGIKKAIVPRANANECCGVDIEVVLVQTLQDVKNALELGGFNKMKKKEIEKEVINGIDFPILGKSIPFMIKGNDKAVFALTVAAAGGHNVLFTGAPGCGKTLLMQMFPYFLPLNTQEESMSVNRIHSLAGLIKQNEPLVRIPPFRIPHQTATIEGICGGGTNCRPGEISLAHNGVLFLDEAAEFRSSVLQMLRVPLESGFITLSRAGRTTIYPARFQLLMTSNPCPCGNYGVTDRICLCSAHTIENYWKKFSGPLLDRVEIRINFTNGEESETSIYEIRKIVATATMAQRKRGKKNADLSPNEIINICKLDKETRCYLNREVERNGFSQRAVSSLLRVSRTIADMDGCENIKLEHVKSAISLRESVGIY